MFMSYNDKSVRLTGRFYREKDGVSTTACGSYIELAFKGDYVILHFDMSDLVPSYPLIYLQIDDGDLSGAGVAARIYLRTKSKGSHKLKIIFQSAVEVQSRWYAPVEAKICFEGYEAEQPDELEVTNQKTITFIGDSITEGILIHPKETPFGKKSMDRVYQNDVTRTYAWQVANHFNLRPTFCGYGAVGLTRPGSGDVPKAADMYEYCVDKVKWEEAYTPDYIMINHGCNDRGAEAAEYLAEYENFLKYLTAKYPDTEIIILSPFVGAFHEELGEFVKAFNENNNSDILYIDSFGWVPKDPLHPLVAGHAKIADEVIKILSKLIH